MIWIHCDGYLGKDPELRHTPSGQEVCQFSVGCFAGKTKDGKKLTQWFTCTVWGKAATVAAERLRKGTRVYIAGTMNLSEYNEKTYHQIDVKDWQVMAAVEQPKQPAPYDSMPETMDDVPF